MSYKFINILKSLKELLKELIENEKDPKNNKLVIGINVYNYKDICEAHQRNKGILIIDVCF